MINWIIENYELISLPLGMILTWYTKDRFFTKRDLKDRDVNTESNQSEIVSKNLELYQRMLDDIEKRYEERLFKSDKEKEELELEIKELKKLVQKLQDEANIVEITIHKLNQQIITLKDKLENYND